MSHIMDFEVAIVGGGPGGLVSALYLGRYKRSVVVINNGEPRARWIPRIRNLIGYTEGLTGPEMLDKLTEQAAKVKAEFMQGAAVVHPRQGFFELHMGARVVRAQKVILATGMQDLQPLVPNYEELRRDGNLAYCPICDGFEHADDEVALLVDGCHCLEKSIHMARLMPKLHIVGISDFKVSQDFQDEVAQRGLRFSQGELERLEPLEQSKGLRIHLKGQVPIEVKVGYVALGVTVQDSAFSHIEGLNRTKEGFLTVTTHQETTVPGLYAVGDCVSGLSQVSVAVGQAAIATTHAHNNLDF